MGKNEKKRHLHPERFEKVKRKFAKDALLFPSPVCFYRGDIEAARQSMNKATIGCLVPWGLLYREDMPNDLPECEVFDLSKDAGWAELLGYSASNFSNIRTGRRTISAGSLKLISNLSGWSTKYLCGESDTPTEEQEAREAFRAERTREEILFQALSISMTGKAVSNQDSLFFPVQYSPLAFEVDGASLDGQTMGALLDVIDDAIRGAARAFLKGCNYGTKGPLKFSYSFLPDDEEKQ